MRTKYQYTINFNLTHNTYLQVSLLQVATPTVVLLVRICNLNFTLPDNVKLVLEDPTICKVFTLIALIVSVKIKDEFKMNKDKYSKYM